MDVIASEVICFFFFKQKTAYELRISDWSSYVCSSDLRTSLRDCSRRIRHLPRHAAPIAGSQEMCWKDTGRSCRPPGRNREWRPRRRPSCRTQSLAVRSTLSRRSKEHTSELQSLMRISYAVFCLKKKKHHEIRPQTIKTTTT